MLSPPVARSRKRLSTIEAPKVNAYSLESSIAEKLEAIVKNGFLNSRYKDFYDEHDKTFNKTSKQ